MTKKKLFHQDSASAYTSAISKLYELGFQLLPYPPYSLNLASSDFFLSPKLKTHLACKKLLSDEEVIAAAEGFFADLKESVYKEGYKLCSNTGLCMNLRECLSFAQNAYMFSVISSSSSV